MIPKSGKNPLSLKFTGRSVWQKWGSGGVWEKPCCSKSTLRLHILAFHSTAGTEADGNVNLDTESTTLFIRWYFSASILLSVDLLKIFSRADRSWWELELAFLIELLSELAYLKFLCCSLCYTMYTHRTPSQMINLSIFSYAYDSRHPNIAA